MCGRFSAAFDYSSLAEQYRAQRAPNLPKSSWNIAPGATIAIIAQDRNGIRHLNPARWGLIPSWSVSNHLDYPTHNARVETALTKRTYADAARCQRAIIPASGYYEWTKDHRPFYFQSPDESPLAIAGLYSWWREDEHSPWLLTATILTTQAEGEAALVHERMPLLITEANADEWLDPGLDGSNVFPRVMDLGRKSSAGLVQHQVAPLKGDGPQLTDDISLRL